MPIKYERLMALLLAGEDALSALDEVGQRVARELSLVESGREDGLTGIRNLSALLSPEILLRNPMGTREVLIKERALASPLATRERQRKRRQQMRKRLRRLGEAELDPTDIDPLE